MNYKQNQNKINHLLSMLRRAYRDRTYRFIFSFKCNYKAFLMQPEMYFELNVGDNIDILEKGNQILLGFRVPKIWWLNGFELSEGVDDEYEQAYRWFMRGMRQVKDDNPQKFKEIIDEIGYDVTGVNFQYKDELMDSDWFRQNVIDELLNIKENIELHYRVKRVIGGLFTNPDDFCPLIQIDFDTDQLYMIKGGKFVSKDIPASKITYTDLKRLSRIKFNSFEGTIQGYRESVNRIGLRM